MLTFVVGSLLTFLHLFLILYCASAWALRLLPGQPLHIKLTATSIGTWWLAGLIFAFLIPLGQFNTTTVSILLAVLTMITAVKIQGPSLIVGFHRPFQCRQIYVDGPSTLGSPGYRGRAGGAGGALCSRHNSAPIGLGCANLPPAEGRAVGAERRLGV